ncbi:MAG: DndE family protein [Thaumarchaeota archaeon]|nr:DndE family protein [Nitrososphaerota archaeon]
MSKAGDAAASADVRFPESVRISSRSRGLLSMIKSRTGIQQSASARLALCLSLADRSEEPDAGEYDEEGSELRASDVFGECRDAYEALLAYMMHGCSAGTGEEHTRDFLRAHVNRGITMLFTRVGGLADVGSLVQPPIVGKGGGGGA